MRTIDARGKWVMPGLLDVHTHYDAEVLLSPGLGESVRHGTTSIVLGNCSLSTVYSDADDCADMFARVEALSWQIVHDAVKEAKTWSSPAEYVKALDSLPLGVNVVRRALGPALVSRVSRVLRASIAWALANRDEMIAALAAEDRGEKALSNPALIDHYLNLYANQDTAAIADDARRAVDVLFARASAAGLLAGDVAADWSD